jgi:hypothetical protein
MPRAKKVEVVQLSTAAIQALAKQEQDIAAAIAAEDRSLIAQFATGLLRDGTGAYDADDIALRNRVKDAFNRARVMLEEFKKFEV